MSFSTTTAFLNCIVKFGCHLERPEITTTPPISAFQYPGLLSAIISYGACPYTTFVTVVPGVLAA